MMLSVISFAYFKDFSNLNISGTNTDVFAKCLHSFTEFYVINHPQKSRG